MKPGRGVVAGVSIAHERASVDQIAAAAPDDEESAVSALLAEPGVEEAFVLQTCNRVEAYAVGGDVDVDAVFARFTDPVPDATVVAMDHEASLRHLLRVSAGLESVILGEDQILGQIRDAYQRARAAGGVGPVLEEALTKAIHVGERARTETDVNEGALSLASAAVRLAATECDLAGETALVVGAGEMGRLAAEALATEVEDLLVANRTVSNAEAVVDDVAIEGRAIPLDRLPSGLDRAGVVVSATGCADRVLEPGPFADAGETVVVDIAQPPDVHEAVRRYDHVAVRDLDDLETVTAETRRRRHAAAEEVEAMVDAEYDNLVTQYKRKRADQVVSSMYESAERVKAGELETALSKLDLDEDEAAVVESMADAIVSQLLAAPTRSLRDAAEEDDWSTIHTALQLFDPEFELDAAGVESGDLGATGPADAPVDDLPDGVREDIPATVLEQLSDD